MTKLENMKLNVQNKTPPITCREIEQYITFYRNEGFSIVPLAHGGKVSLIDWKELQNRKLTDEEVKEYFLSGRSVNIGIICGKISGNLVVVDVDAGDPDKALKIAQKMYGASITKDTMVVKSAHGCHVYFKSMFPVKTTRFNVGSECHIDVQSDGTLVAAPPSLHPDGVQYTLESNFATPMMWDGDLLEDLFTRARKIDKKFRSDKLRSAINVGDLLNGVDEGNRDQSALYIATYYRQKGKSEEETYKLIENWNTKNQPPMNEDQIRKCLRSAYKNDKPYNFKFIELIGESFSAGTEQSAAELLEQPEIIPAILEATNEIVEEEGTRVGIYLIELVAESLELGGESSTGKNTILDAVLACYPQDMYIKMTGESEKALRYLGQAPTVYFAERRGFQTGKDKGKDESVAEYDIKVALSEGKIVSYVTVKDEDGKWEAKPHVSQIRNVLMSSTDVNCTPELKNRIWQTTTDYAPEHVGNVVNRKLSQKAMLPKKRINTTAKKETLRCMAQMILDKKTWMPTLANYVVPYAPELAGLLGQDPRASRDADKLMKLIYASALLHQKNRPVVDDDVLVCTPEDLYNAIKWCKELVFGTISGGEQTKWFEDRWKTAKAILDANKMLNAQTFMQIGRMAQSVAYKWLDRFEQAGLIMKQIERGKVWYISTLEDEKPEDGKSAEGISIDLDWASFWEITEKWMINNGFSLSALKDRKNISYDVNSFSIRGGRNGKVGIDSITIDDLPDKPQGIDSWGQSGFS